jgi:hypothetical protein
MGGRRQSFRSTNERDERFFDLYEITLDGIGAYSLQERRGLTGGRSLATSGTRTVEVKTFDSGHPSLRSGANTTRNMRRIRIVISADFSPDGSKLVYVSDEAASSRRFAHDILQ